MQHCCVLIVYCTVGWVDFVWTENSQHCCVLIVYCTIGWVDFVRTENSQHCCVLLYTVHCTIGWVDFVAMRKVYYVLIPGNESVLMDFLCNAALLCTYCILYSRLSRFCMNGKFSALLCIYCILYNRVGRFCGNEKGLLRVVILWGKGVNGFSV